jgi:hypothetical protein
VISVFVNELPLFAARDWEGDLGEFKGLPNVGPYELLILSIVTLLVIVTIVWQSISRHRRRDFDYNRPARLFADLCRAHNLNWSSRRLLKHLAAARDLKCPATLFVEPEYFDMANIPPALKASASEVRQLRHRLFD